MKTWCLRRCQGSRQFFIHLFLVKYETGLCSLHCRLNLIEKFKDCSCSDTVCLLSKDCPLSGVSLRTPMRTLVLEHLPKRRTGQMFLNTSCWKQLTLDFERIQSNLAGVFCVQRQRPELWQSKGNMVFICLFFFLVNGKVYQNLTIQVLWRTVLRNISPWKQSCDEIWFTYIAQILLCGLIIAWCFWVLPLSVSLPRPTIQSILK